MVLAAAVIVTVGLLAAMYLFRSPEQIVRGATRRQCLVSCKDGSGFSGVLWSADRGCLLLKQVVMVGDGGSAPMDGEVLILRDDVAFIQLP